MSIIMVRVKTNRFYRRTMNTHNWIVQPNSDIQDQELDDLNNMFSGCAFE